MSVFTTKDASLWIQFRLGDRSYYLGDCVDLDSIPNPRLGGIEYGFCWNAKRTGFRKINKHYSPPGSIEFAIGALLEPTMNWLDEIQCPVTAYAMKRSCDDAGVFRNWIRAAILYESEVLNDELGAYAQHVEDNDTTQTYSMIAPPPRIDVFRLKATRQTIARVEGLWAIAACMNLRCDDVCGVYTVPGNDIIVNGDAAGGTKAVLYNTEDKGVNWAAESAGGAWANGQDVRSLACFEISTGVERWLQARASVGGQAFQVAFSDDEGDTWTTVTVSATVAEGATGPKALYAYDSRHIWLVSSAGIVYFSEDGGATWEAQDSVDASGANPLNAIHGFDAANLVAVGDSDTVIYSYDGGGHWTAASATGSGDDLLAVTMFTQMRWLIGSDGAAAATSSLFITYDGGVTYDERDFTGHDTEMVSDMSFAAPGVGIIITNSQTSFASGGSVHMTIDGGYTWEEIAVPDNTGFYGVVMTSTKQAFVVGAPEGGSAIVLSVGLSPS